MGRYGNHLIILKEYITEEDLKKTRELESECKSFEDINLKLELDYKLMVRKETDKSIRKENEFFYYIGEKLVGYAGICSFGQGFGEINGMVHPDYRRRGIFDSLYSHVISECKKRNFKKILLLSDHKSNSGISFIESKKTVYLFSECNMGLSGESMGMEPVNIALRRAVNSDAAEISRQNSIYFGIQGDEAVPPEEEENNRKTTYMIEHMGDIIGKISTGIEGDSAYISGFGVLPDYRGRGFGREALLGAVSTLRKKGISQISLDVETKNLNALNLYKSCGFIDRAVMDYFEVL